MKIAITGITGLVGNTLFKELKKKDNNQLIGIIRKKNNMDLNVGDIFVDSINAKTIYNLPSNLDAIVHCAAHMYINNGPLNNPLEMFREVNTYGTLNLAQQAVKAGVKRFVFISSIKVNGESTRLGYPFTPNSEFIPTDPYALSKYEAEVGLRKIAEESAMEVVIVRPPLVYGTDVKGNFASMMKWIHKGVPLPLGGIKNNLRSLVSVDNLVDLIITCIHHPKAANQIFLVSDDDDLSTASLLANTGMALGVKSRLISIPCSWIIWAAKLMGKPVISDRLCGSLHVDISKTKCTLDWKPPYRAAECMKKTADAFIQSNGKF